MSDNKVDNKLDFRNITVTQFDPGQTQKMAFSEYQSAYKQFNTNAILKRPYSHFIQVLDGQGRPTKVEYYQATHPARDRINVRADNSGDLAGTYITLTEFISKKTYVYYFVVSGSGTAPGIGDVERAVNINTNDPASLVAFALKTEFKNTDEFIVIGDQLLAGYIDIEYLQFGETAAINVGTTGFLTTRLNEGQSFLAGEVELSYDVDGNPIYNGNVLKGLLFNPFTASFDPERAEINVVATVDLSDLVCDTPEIFNVSMPTANTEYSQVLPLGTKRIALRIQNSGSTFQVAYVSSGPYYTVRRGTEYTEENLKIDTTNDTIYFKGRKNNLTMEILTWR
jgi:hypothetical protein